MFRTRTEHDCQCCKQFIRRLGVVVAIQNGEMVCGCDKIELVQGGKKPQEKTAVVKFDAASAADELAKQAEWSNNAASEMASEVVDGILKIASERKSLPDDFIAKVRAAVPGLDRRPGADLSADDVQKIRDVR